MFEISPENEKNGIYKLRTIPKLGYLSRNGTRLWAGSKFTQYEIRNGIIKYHHTTIPDPDLDPEASLSDSFTFSLWDPELGDITRASYSECLIEEEQLDPPLSGIYVFQIQIDRMKAPVVVVVDSNVIEHHSIVLNQDFIQTTSFGVSSNEVVHTIKKPFVNGYLSVRGVRADSFTQADVDSNSVRYTCERKGSGTDSLEFQTCSRISYCTSSTLNVTIADEYKQTGDNVIYAKVDGIFNWQFSSNVPHSVWKLQGGTTLGPPGAVEPDVDIVEWTTYTTTNDLPPTDPGRGPGFDKLPEYKNLKEDYYWEGGLPFGVACSNLGYFGTQDRKPLSLAGRQPWRLPRTPGRYSFTLVSTDPVSGATAIRRYALVVTHTGLSDDGLQSESENL